MSAARLAAVLLAVLLTGCGGSSWRTHNITHLMPDLEFSLTGEGGDTVTASHFRGRISLVYFGFTWCKMACPMTMARLHEVLKKLGPRADDVRVLFVSVDPKRDTPERLRDYTAYFGPQFTGLTGNGEPLDALVRRYRVSYSYGKPDARGNYPVYHSSGVFVFDGQGRARLLIRDSDTVPAIVADLEQLLKG